jgi:hypothetical protein
VKLLVRETPPQLSQFLREHTGESVWLTLDEVEPAETPPPGTETGRHPGEARNEHSGNGTGPALEGELVTTQAVWQQALNAWLAHLNDCDLPESTLGRSQVMPEGDRLYGAATDRGYEQDAQEARGVCVHDDLPTFEQCTPARQGTKTQGTETQERNSGNETPEGKLRGTKTGEERNLARNENWQERKLRGTKTQERKLAGNGNWRGTKTPRNGNGRPGGRLRKAEALSSAERKRRWRLRQQEPLTHERVLVGHLDARWARL